MISEILARLQDRLASDLAQIRFLLRKSPAAGYARIVEIGREVGAQYGVKLIVNFPKEGRIEQFEMYGKRDLSIIVDYDKRRFPIDRGIIKQKAAEMLGDISTEDAYMYEDKEGVRVRIGAEKIDILPHSLHVWTEFTGPVTAFCDWLAAEVYDIGSSR